MNKKVYFEYCTLCEKLYEKRCRKQHFRTKKHHELLLEKNLKDENIEIILYSLTNIEKNDDEETEDNNTYYLPNDS